MLEQCNAPVQTSHRPDRVGAAVRRAGAAMKWAGHAAACCSALTLTSISVSFAFAACRRSGEAARDFCTRWRRVGDFLPCKPNAYERQRLHMRAIAPERLPMAPAAAAAGRHCCGAGRPASPPMRSWAAVASSAAARAAPADQRQSQEAQPADRRGLEQAGAALPAATARSGPLSAEELLREAAKSRPDVKGTQRN